MNVWTYWEGPKPAYISLCLQSMRRACNVPGISFEVVTPESVLKILPDKTLHKNYRILPQAALRADCIRAALLAEHGGWWWDADTIALRTPPIITSSSFFYMVWKNPPTRVLNGYIHLQKNSETAIAWLEEINQLLAEKVEAIAWCDLGEKILTDRLIGNNSAYEIHRSTYLPIDIDSNVQEFFTTNDFRKYITEHTICYGLNHSWFMYHHPKAMNMNPQEWQNSPLLIHQLLAAELAKSKLC